MPATLDITCPNCGKGLKVPAEFEGKRIKCRDCGEAFPVKAKAAPKAGKPAAKPPAKPAAKAGAKAAPPAAAPEKPKGRFDDDEEDELNPKAMQVIHEDDSARCPHCAQPLDPPDAVVCTNCGYNNKTRVLAETKKVWAPDAMDWIQHLWPGVAALAIVIGLIVLDVYCWLNMESWLEGSDLQDDQADPVTGKKKFFVRPGAFSMLITAVSAIIILPASAFAWRRLVRDYRPFEQQKK